MKKILFILLLLAAVSWKFYNHTSRVTLGPGVMAGPAPQQHNLASPVCHKIKDYTIREISQFRIKAKVLSKTNYHFDRESDLSPTDLALGWGRMSDENILKKIEISQSHRFYRWYVEKFPIPRREIETHSANMHLIPANDSVKDIIDSVRIGDIIEMSGSLVNVSSDSDGWHWSSSLTRNDTGNGACELILVKDIEIVTL